MKNLSEPTPPISVKEAMLESLQNMLQLTRPGSPAAKILKEKILLLDKAIRLDHKENYNEAYEAYTASANCGITLSEPSPSISSKQVAIRKLNAALESAKAGSTREQILKKKCELLELAIWLDHHCQFTLAQMAFSKAIMHGDFDEG